MNTPRTQVYQYIADPDRGRLGMVLYPEPKEHGYLVDAVTPDGPAQQAGVRVGDVITHVNGQAILVGSPMANLQPLGNIKAGTTYKLGLLRGGKPTTVSVKAEHNALWQLGTAPPATVGSVLSSALGSAMAAVGQASNEGTLPPDVAKALRYTHHALQVLGPYTFSFTTSPWWGLNLAPLNTHLASYFGTSHGALVLSTKPRRYPGLEAGDVITSVNGKSVNEPEDVMRALRGQLPGMTVHLTVCRHGKVVDVKMQVPSASKAAPPALHVTVGKVAS